MCADKVHTIFLDISHLITFDGLYKDSITVFSLDLRLRISLDAISEYSCAVAQNIQFLRV